MRKEGPQEWTESGDTGCRDSDPRFSGRPNSDIGGGVEEVGDVGQAIDVREANNGCR